MTLEFDRPLLSNIGLNSSYNNETDFTALDRVTSKKSSVISVTRKEGLLAREKFKEKREMSGRYSDDYDSYEDDFDDESPAKESTTRRSSRRESRMSERVRSTSRSPSPKYRSRSKKSSSRRDSFASYRSAYGTNRGPAKNKGKKSHSASSKMTTKTVGGESSMMRRVLSANRNKVSRLHNVVEELQQEMEELKEENKSLKRVSHRQERQIKKIDEEEASLPMLLQRHSAEMRTLKERLRRNQEILHKKEKESRDHDHEIQKLRDKVSSYRELSKDKKLEERAALAKKLEKLQSDMAEKDKKITDLEKSVTLKDKARQREMKDQKERYRQAKEELKRVQQDFRSLRDRLKEKERELDEKNIYHYHITQHKKKGTTLPALPAATAASPAPAMIAPAIHVKKSAGAKEEKRTNVFITNAPSDSGSVITDEGKDVVVKSDTAGVQQGQPVVPVSVRHDRTDDGDRLRREAEERRRREEDERRRRIEEDEERKRRQEEEERRRREEEHERRRREEEEQLQKQREEQERARKQREDEEEKKRLDEEAEIRRKKDLLLARMRAIDTGSDKPNGVIQSIGAVAPPAAEDKPKKLPIFLQSDKPAKTETQPAKPTANVAASDDDIFSDASGGRNKVSAGSKQSRYSYDFKQTVDNLHHGLPAHASQEPDAKDSLSDDLNFGSYKPTLGRRAAAKRDAKDKDDLSFGSYNPSFGAKKETNRRNSGLDFGAGKKNIPEKEQNGVIFGDKTSSSQPNGNVISGRTSPAQGRRAKGLAGKGTSLFGDDLFTNEEVKPTGNPLFGDSSAFNKDKSAYPWENKVTVTRKSSQPQSQEDSLLPRRKHMQSIGKSAEKNVRAVDNALDDVDDDIEEVIL